MASLHVLDFMLIPQIISISPDTTDLVEIMIYQLAYKDAIFYTSLGFIGFAHCLQIIAQPHAELFKSASYVAIFRHVRWRMEMHTC